MALVGPLTSLIIGGLAWLLLHVIGGGTSQLPALLGYLAVMNVLLGLFNLIPGFPLVVSREDVVRFVEVRRGLGLARENKKTQQSETSERENHHKTPDDARSQ